MKNILILVALFSVSCSSIPTTKANNVKNIKKMAQNNWITHKDLKMLSETPNKLYVVFASPKCASCIHLRTALTRIKIHKHVAVINVEEKWANSLAQNLKIKGIPTLLAMNETMGIDHHVQEPGNIILFLILYSDIIY